MISTLEVTEAGTMGVAILAGAACGLYGSVKDGVSHLVRTKRVFEPDPKVYEQYQEIYGAYQKLYPAMKWIYEK